MTKLYSLLFLMLLLASCKSDITMDLDEQTNLATNFNFGNTAQRNFHGLVLATNGSPVSGATVTIGTKTAQTNTKGIFVINNADVKENFAHVKVTKSGFVNGARTIVPTTGNNRINVMMIPATTTLMIASGTTSTVSLPNGTKVKFDGSFKDESGANYTGNVNVALYHLAPSNQYLNELMPGSFLATNTDGNSRIMETYGMLHVQLTGTSGQKLQIASGHTAEMTVAIDAAQMSTSPATIPLWAFNETTGIWQEEGVATKVGNAYVGNVSHFSWWNCDVQFPVATLKVNLKNSAGQPLSNVKVGLKRNSQTYETYGMSDANGAVSGLIPANETLILKAYNQCDVVLYTANVGPYTAGSFTTLPDISIQSSPAIASITINGTLKNCAGGNVTDGIAILNFQPSNTYFQGGTAIVTNGTFSINTISCNANQQFSLEGFDVPNMQTSGGINFTGVSPITNLGNISVCTSITEFVNYQIDAQPTVNCMLGFNTMLEANNLSISHHQSPIGNSPYFHLFAPGANSVGTYTTGFTVFTGPNTPTNATGNNLTLQISQFGTVNNYIDFTINGTYTDTMVSPNVTRTLSVTGHVKRDF